MLTKSDFKKLEEKFVTKNDLKNELKKFATKDDLKNELKNELKKYATKADLDESMIGMTNEFKTVIEMLGAISEKIDLIGSTSNSHSKILLEYDEKIRNLEHKVFQHT